MPVRADDRWSYRGFRAVVLENEHIRADFFPELGAKLYNLIDKRSGENLLWHHPRVELRAAPLGASYDDNFCGGWDELFPNDAAGVVGDAFYPDHGELWTQPWEHETASDVQGVTLHMRRPAATTTTIVEKWVTLRADEACLRFRHRITNVGTRSLDFLWKLHPALVIEPGDRIDVPGRTGEVVDATFGLIREPRPFSWPIANTSTGPVDFSVVRSMNGTRDFLYVRDLDAGWCALRRMRHDVGVALTFPKEIFSSVWLFMTFGGWRGLETVVLEPCTAVPKDLNEAIRLRQCSHLEPGERLECEVLATIFHDVTTFRGTGPDGSILR